MYTASVKTKGHLLIFAIVISTLFTSWKFPIKEENNKIFVSHFENVLGTSFEMKVKTTSSGDALVAEKIALNEIKRLSKILSAYDEQSEFSTWMHTLNTPVKASKELIEVLSLFDTWKSATKGALNPAFEVVSNIWQQAQETQVLPHEEALKTAVKDANETHWKIDYKNGSITHLTNTPLKLNTFVKSYIIEHAAKKVGENTNVNDIVINIGGDILVSGNHSETIEISNPKASAINEDALDIVNIKNKFIATSGNYKRGNLIKNNWYSHIIDVRTGIPVDHIISATVIADDATEAGALATAFNIMSIQESIQIAQQFPNVAYLIVDKNGKQIKSENWATFQVEKENKALTSNPLLDNTQWNPKYELIVNLELAKIEGSYKRPFVAVWVENENKTPVRTLSVWYNKPRYIRDLKTWYRANFSSFNVESQTMNSVSSATRPAGKYAIKWDGKDDSGQYVKQGNYIVNIEVAREHGTYQLITKEININNKATKIELPSNPEIASASLELKMK